jgi:2-oxoglutarate dehydrogenase complex dehydrogenase (E1) component-like enzyme
VTARPDFAAVFGVNAAYAEKVYGDWQRAPESVPAEWRHWFGGMPAPETRAPARGPVSAGADARSRRTAAADRRRRQDRNMEESHAFRQRPRRATRA